MVPLFYDEEILPQNAISDFVCFQFPIVIFDPKFPIVNTPEHFILALNVINIPKIWNDLLNQYASNINNHIIILQINMNEICT